MSATTRKGQERHKGTPTCCAARLPCRTSSKGCWPSHGERFNVISRGALLPQYSRHPLVEP
jgi:hypothetical protein